jgi:uncharacterized protein (DUF433 family)
MTPGTCGGKPRIAGTRIRVQDIVIWTEQGETPDEIVNGHPHLSLSDIHAALAYYYDNQDLIDRHIVESEQFVADMMKQQAEERRQRQAEADAAPFSY